MQKNFDRVYKGELSQIDTLINKSTRFINDLKEMEYQLIKEKMINRERKRIKHQSENVEYGHIITDYFEDEIESIQLIADRTAEPGPERLEDKYKDWWIKGFCTYNEWKGINSFNKWIRNFKEEYKYIQTTEYDLYLNIIGGIEEGKVLINSSTIEELEKLGIYIESYGFDDHGKLIRLTDLRIEAFKNETEESDTKFETCDNAYIN